MYNNPIQIFDFLLRQCDYKTISQIKKEMEIEGVSISVKVIRCFVNSQCAKFPDTCDTKIIKVGPKKTHVNSYKFFNSIRPCLNGATE